MGTVIGIRKEHSVILGADCVNVRDPALTGETSKGLSCLFRLGDSVIALNSTLGYQTAFEAALEAVAGKEPPALDSRTEIHAFFSKMHVTLRNHGFMFVSFQQGQDFEWTPMTALLANRSGLYRIDSARGVIECPKYAALGTGEAFALGALAAGYESLEPEALAASALAAVSALDPLSGHLKSTLSVRAPTLSVAPRVSPSELPRVKRIKPKGKKSLE
jgi:ATP-dependent HslUV protease subunit HslV